MAKPTVNLDAMIDRADFAATSRLQTAYENVSTISIRDFDANGLVGLSLRKPDFQRETNHWIPEQVVSLLECFINGDLIPGVILWQSDSFLFVIDGGHRLSVLKAWVLDDYGDGPRSLAYFKDSISKDQLKAAEKARRLIAEKIGTYQHFKARIESGQHDAKTSSVVSRGIQIQWVKGDVEKAESSFFKINTQGTPLDDIEEALLKYRKRPIPIVARGIIRAGYGHKYWSKFPESTTKEIEEKVKILHHTLLDPEISSPVKTLDLPLGGSKGVRQALQVLIDYLSISTEVSAARSLGVEYGKDDEDGSESLAVIRSALKLSQRITGNENGSLGLHPAVYFYGPSGAHSIAMFLGTARHISRMLADNNKTFFKDFCASRAKIEQSLVQHKDLISTVLQKLSSKRRVAAYEAIFRSIVESHISDVEISQEMIVEWGGLKGKIIVGSELSGSKDFSDDEKSKSFIRIALSVAPTCPICSGYLDITKSVSYDHILRKEDGGMGDDTNCQLTHPFCNQAIKN